MTMADLAEEMTADYHRNLEAMGIDTIDHFPRATQNMARSSSSLSRSSTKTSPYESDGDVYFDVTRDAEYGKLSNPTLPACKAKGATWPSGSVRRPTLPSGKAPSRA